MKQTSLVKVAELTKWDGKLTWVINRGICSLRAKIGIVISVDAVSVNHTNIARLSVPCPYRGDAVAMCVCPCIHTPLERHVSGSRTARWCVYWCYLSPLSGRTRHQSVTTATADALPVRGSFRLDLARLVGPSAGVVPKDQRC